MFPLETEASLNAAYQRLKSTRRVGGSEGGINVAAIFDLHHSRHERCNERGRREINKLAVGQMWRLSTLISVRKRFHEGQANDLTLTNGIRGRESERSAGQKNVSNDSQSRKLLLLPNDSWIVANFKCKNILVFIKNIYIFYPLAWNCCNLFKLNLGNVKIFPRYFMKWLTMFVSSFKSNNPLSARRLLALTCYARLTTALRNPAED